MKIFKEGRQRLFENDTETAAAVSSMLIELEKNGMDAVRRYSRQFDAWDPPSFRLSSEQIAEAVAQVPEQGIRDTDFCQQNVRCFAQAQLQTLQTLEVETRPGVILGHRHIPVNSVGSYIPGGRYPMFGSAQMSIIPARVAGVKRIIACTPPVKGRGYYPATINAMTKAGADYLYILGGVPALALMAFGLDGLPPVDVLCGAGNKYVAEAKRQLFGRCGIDLLAGPTEILVLADDTADPALLACDLLGQAEHDPASGVCLICLSEDFAARAVAELEKQLAVLPTREVASLSGRDHGIVYVADSEQEAVELSDRYAPEHLELHVRNVDYFFRNLTNYGSLFIGEQTTVAYGDKTIGTNHILPTSRAARYTGGLWVGKFLKTCTYQRMTAKATAFFRSRHDFGLELVALCRPLLLWRVASNPRTCPSSRLAGRRRIQEGSPRKNRRELFSGGGGRLGRIAFQADPGRDGVRQHVLQQTLALGDERDLHQNKVKTSRIIGAVYTTVEDEWLGGFRSVE